MMRGFWAFPGVRLLGHHLGGIDTTGAVLLVVLWIAVVAADVIAIWALIHHSPRNAAGPRAWAPPATPYGPGSVSAAITRTTLSVVAILEERYARGDIGREEFLQKKQDLGITGPSNPPTTTPPGGAATRQDTSRTADQ